jgi:hypothetical protein
MSEGKYTALMHPQSFSLLLKQLYQIFRMKYPAAIYMRNIAIYPLKALIFMKSLL